MDDFHKARWEKGRFKTIYFYRKKLPWKAKQFNRIFPLYDYFGPMIGDKKEVKIAEIGCGMFCTIGSTWKTARVKVYASDALADEYNQILKDHKVTPLIPVAKQNMERLPYSDNFFDIVHCVNALDHTADPIKAVTEMYRVCKPGGFIYLRHFVNVGKNEKYAGLHIWNIDVNNDNNCVIWNQEARYLLSEYFRGFTSVKKKELDYEPDDMVVSILQK